MIFRIFASVRREELQQAFIFGTALLVSACSAQSYAGISLAPAGGLPAVQALARRAQGGDKWAQVALGRRFECGDGVVVNYSKAARFYRLAARDSGGLLWIYTPPTEHGTVGRVVSVDSGPQRAGLAIAKELLDRIKQGHTNCGSAT